jgi:hypothetical protein
MIGPIRGEATSGEMAPRVMGDQHSRRGTQLADAARWSQRRLTPTLSTMRLR